MNAENNKHISKTMAVTNAAITAVTATHVRDSAQVTARSNTMNSLCPHLQVLHILTVTNDILQGDD